MNKYSQSWKMLNHLANEDAQAVENRVNDALQRREDALDRAIESVKELGILFDEWFGLKPKK